MAEVQLTCMERMDKVEAKLDLEGKLRVAEGGVSKVPYIAIDSHL